MKANHSNFRTLRPGDVGFTMNDGFLVANRAALELDPKCPMEYRTIIQTALSKGWLKPVAVIRDYELTREALN